MHIMVCRQGYGAGAQTTLDGRRRSQRLLDVGAGPLNFGSGSKDIFCGASELMQVMQWFLVFNGPNCAGTGTKNF